MPAHVIVDNNTGHAIRAIGCHALFTVALASSAYHPIVGTLTCLQQFTVPAGRSSYPVTVLASYLGCNMNGTPPCRPGTHPATPLPPGSYHARLFFLVRQFAPVPPAIPVQVTPQR